MKALSDFAERALVAGGMPAGHAQITATAPYGPTYAASMRTVWLESLDSA